MERSEGKNEQAIKMAELEILGSELLPQLVSICNHIVFMDLKTPRQSFFGESEL